MPSQEVDLVCRHPVEPRIEVSASVGVGDLNLEQVGSDENNDAEDDES